MSSTEKTMLRVNCAPQVTAQSMGLIYPMSISRAGMLKQLHMSPAGMEFLLRVQIFLIFFSEISKLYNSIQSD